MRGMVFLTLWIALRFPVFAVPFEELRDKEVTYLDQDYPAPIEGTLIKLSAIYSERDFTSKLAVLSAQTKVRILGQHPDGWLIEAQPGARRFEGWVAPDALPPLDSKIWAVIKSNQSRRLTVAKAIAEKRVIRGMTMDEVTQALGKPEKTSQRDDSKGQIASWSYTSFERVPRSSFVKDARGQLYESMVYVKVPVGEQVIEFTDGVVTATEQHKTTGEAKSALIENAPIFTQ